MSLLLYRNIKITRNQIVISAFLFYLILSYSLFAFLIITGRDYVDYLLRDDGYYSIAGNFAKGNFNSGSVIGPGLPLIYTPIHIFNETLHPYIRLIISQMVVLAILFIVSKLTRQYLNKKQLLCGLLMVIIQPVFLQWTFRTSVDLFLSLFLGLFILYLFKYIEQGKIIHFIFFIIAFAYAIFTRPSFIFIPFMLLIVAIFILRSRKISLISFALIIITGLCFYTNNMYLQRNIGSANFTIDSGRSRIIISNFIITETIIKTGQFHKGTIDNYSVNEDLNEEHIIKKGVDYIYSQVLDFQEKYKSMHPDGNSFHMVWYFIKNNPKVFIAKILLGPVFFFALSSREIMSYILLVFIIGYFILTLHGLKPLIIKKVNRDYFILLFSILFGYFLLHWVTHAYSRYSLVILPYLFIWTGPQVVKLLAKIKGKIHKGYLK